MPMGSSGPLQPDDHLEILKRHATMLREHFDSVQILVCRKNEDGDTQRFEWGLGSWYERYGLLRVAVLEREAEQQERSRRDVDDDA